MWPPVLTLPTGAALYGFTAQSGGILRAHLRGFGEEKKCLHNKNLEKLRPKFVTNHQLEMVISLWSDHLLTVDLHSEKLPVDPGPWESFVGLVSAWNLRRDSLLQILPGGTGNAFRVKAHRVFAFDFSSKSRLNSGVKWWFSPMEPPCMGWTRGCWLTLDYSTVWPSAQIITAKPLRL